MSQGTADSAIASTPTVASVDSHAEPAGYTSPGSASATEWTEGLLMALQPGVQQCDQNIAQVFQAQQALATQIDRLAAALATFQTSPRPPALSGYTTKLASSRKRLKKLNENVGKISARVEDMRALVRKKEGIVPPGQANAPKSSSASSLFEKLSNLKLGGNKDQPAAAATTAAAAPVAAASTSAPAASSSTAPSTTSTDDSSASSTSNTSSTAAAAVQSAVDDESAQSSGPSNKEKITALLNWESTSATTSASVAATSTTTPSPASAAATTTNSETTKA